MFQAYQPPLTTLGAVHDTLLFGKPVLLIWPPFSIAQWPPFAIAQAYHRVNPVSIWPPFGIVQAYQPLLMKLGAVYDTLLFGKPVLLQGEEIHAPEKVTFESRLIEMAYEADNIIENPDRTLWW